MVHILACTDEATFTTTVTSKSQAHTTSDYASGSQAVEQLCTVCASEKVGHRRSHHKQMRTLYSSRAPALNSTFHALRSTVRLVWAPKCMHNCTHSTLRLCTMYVSLGITCKNVPSAEIYHFYCALCCCRSTPRIVRVDGGEEAAESRVA